MAVNVKEFTVPGGEDRFANKIDHLNIYYSRYIASWVRSGGRINLQFKSWLESIGLPYDEINEIYFLAENGKMELEDSAKRYLKENPPLTRRQELGLDPLPKKVTETELAVEAANAKLTGR